MRNLLLLAVIGLALIGTQTLNAQDGLFISEISDPADEYTGRFIELYNAGSTDIDFDNQVCYLSRQSNGGSSWGEVQLTGSLPAGHTYVCGTSSFASHYGFDPEIVTGILTGNGDDAYVLYLGGDHLSGTVHDVFGEIDVDGTGQPWEYTDSRAVRNSEVLTPSSFWVSDEWTISASTIAQGTPGFHAVTGDPGPGVSDHSLFIASDTVDLGAPFSLAIEVSDLSLSDSIIAFQFNLEYDPLSVNYLGYYLEGTMGEGGSVAVNTADPGKVSIAYMNAYPVTGSGTLILFEFESLRLDTTEVLITNAFLNTLPLPDTSRASILIRENSPPRGVVTLIDTMARFSEIIEVTAIFNEPMSSVHPVNIWFTGAVQTSTVEMERINDTMYASQLQVPAADGWIYPRFGGGEDVFGNPVDSLPVNNAGLYVIRFVPGDVDDDGEILAYDAALVLQHSVGIDPLPDADPLPWEPWRDSTADVNGDGIITAYDAGLILQYSVGLPGFSVLEDIVSADISVEIEQDHLVFYQQGTLVGLNLVLSGPSDRYGDPELIKKDNLMAMYKQDGNMKVGVCAANSPFDKIALLRIPLLEMGPVSIHMTVNTEERELILDSPVMHKSMQHANISVLPNPVSERLVIRGLSEEDEIMLVDMYGKLIRSLTCEAEQLVINVTSMDRGLYVLRIKSGKHIVSRRIVKQ